jgi:hypothetical protein
MEQRYSGRALDLEAPVEVEVLEAPDSSLLSSVSESSVSLSPFASAALAAVESGWAEARRLADLAKNYARASTAAKALCGLKLRAIREYYYGPRDPRGGRPKMLRTAPGGATWESLLADKVGITDDTATNWMKMAAAVESLADQAGLDLRATCEKLPWDWTPEESALVDATVRRLTEDKTQRDLLQSDFLLDLGYSPPPRLNNSPNQLGLNGSDKPKPILSPEESIRVAREAARVELYGTIREGHVDRRSHAHWMILLHDNPELIEALPPREIRAFQEQILQPFSAMIKDLANRK